MPAKDLEVYNFYVIKGDDLSENLGPFQDPFGKDIDTSTGTLSLVFEGDSGDNRFSLSDEEIKRMGDLSVTLEKSRDDAGYSSLGVGAVVYGQLKFLDANNKLRTLVDLVMRVKKSRD